MSRQKLSQYIPIQYAVHLCNADGFDDEAFKDELLVEELDENQLLECWDDINDFPFDPNDTPNDEDGNRKYVIDLITKIVKNPNLVFGINIPNC